MQQRCIIFSFRRYQDPAAAALCNQLHGGMYPANAPSIAVRSCFQWQLLETGMPQDLMNLIMADVLSSERYMDHVCVLALTGYDKQAMPPS